MEDKNGNNGTILNRNSKEDLQGRKANRNSIITAVSIFIILAVVTAIVAGYLYFGKSDYEKGSAFYKEKKFTEALYEFQKVDPGSKDFIKSQSAINYINGLESYNNRKNQDAIVFLSKVRTDDKYYDDAQLMLEKLDEASIGNGLQSQIDELKNNKDTIIIKKEITGKPVKNTDPADPKIQADLELTRKFVSDAGSSISKFEGLYQTARTAPLSSKGDYSKSLESANKEFNSLKYLADNKDAGVMELKSLTAQWMSKRIAFIRQLVIDKTVTETGTSIALKEDGDRLYSAVISQLNKLKRK